MRLSQGDVSVCLLSLGCITQDWQVPLGDSRVPVVLGYAEPEAYWTNPAYLGAIVGPVANRIAGAGFALDGRTWGLPANDGPHHLHGGPQGLHQRLWQVERDADRAARFSLVLNAGDIGYPGRVAYQVTVTLSGAGLTYDMQAHPDRPTPISLAQHSYYALTGSPIHDQSLQIRATGYTPTDAALIPTGRIAPLTGHSFDLRAPRLLQQADPAGAGLDLNYALDPRAPIAARLTAPSGLRLELSTDQPGLQLFTAAGLRQWARPLPGQTHGPSRALCLEPQGFPNAVNTPAFPPVIATPDRPYRQITRVSIRAGDGTGLPRPL